ncbi:hypothetical protein ACIRPN_33365 [Streptomyces sp. NPDC101230]|uniref:hypothetical protein n=1 Tax=unclassified Streptomyces TaxID=2593676 RepID=UPI0037F344DD
MLLSRGGGCGIRSTRPARKPRWRTCNQVEPRTVVWLNEAQHYLGDREAGERIAAALHHLFVAPERGPVLVLETLWPEYAKEYTTLPAPAGGVRSAGYENSSPAGP